MLSRYHVAVSFVIYIIGFILFILSLKKHTLKYQFKQLTWTLFTLLLVVVQSNFIIRNIFKGIFWFFLPAWLIIANDSFAYFCGFAFGKKFIKRGLTKLSPNKTWEGFIGALFCTMAFGFWWSGVLSHYDWFVCPKEGHDTSGFMNALHCVHDPIFVKKDYHFYPIIVKCFELVGLHWTKISIFPAQLHSVVFSLFASLIAPFGGFFASGIKRAYDIKDFDSLFPGHGGVTDRMDCQFIMGLFAYVYCQTFVFTEIPTVDQILFLIHQLPVPEQLKLIAQLTKK